MARDLLSRYIWIIDTIRRYGTITRRELDDCWMRSPFSEGEPLPRRTFFNYREAISELFGLTINYDRARGSYIIEEDRGGDSAVTDWVLNSTAIANLLSDSREVSDHIFLEDVPSSRNHLNVIINSLKDGHTIRFDYHSYVHQPKIGMILEPYFLKIFRQRWYVTGKNVGERKLKTYALDRMENVAETPEKYVIPADFDAARYFYNSFGIVFDEGAIHNVVLKVDPRQAKYFRALPLHHTQDESVCDGYSLFSYRLRLTSDFVAELLSYGPKVTVEAPAELRRLVTESLKQSLKNYGIDSTKG